MQECTILIKNSKIFSPEGPRKNVRGPNKNVSPGPTVALDGPGYNRRQSSRLKDMTV